MKPFMSPVPPQSLHSSQIHSKAKQILKLTVCANTHVIRLPHWSSGNDVPPPVVPEWPLQLSVSGAAS